MSRFTTVLFRALLFAAAVTALVTGGRGLIDVLVPSYVEAGADPHQGVRIAPPPPRRVPEAEAAKLREAHRARCTEARAALQQGLDVDLAPVRACLERAAGRAEAYADWATGISTSCRAVWRSARECVDAAAVSNDGVRETAQRLFEEEFARQVLSSREMDCALADALEGVRRSILAREIELTTQAEADTTAALRTFVLRVDAAPLAARAFEPCRAGATSFLPRVALARLGYEAGAMFVLQPVASALVAATLQAVGVGSGATLLGVGAGWWTAGLSVVAVVGIDLAVGHYAKGAIAERVRAGLRAAADGLLGEANRVGTLRQAVEAALDAEMDRFEGESGAALAGALAP
ncbi:MAG: hypothetical protein HYZ53_29475 [Planctomycetes bacterium]|nr:hypothetical protein [Planctomycetota bacterium]